MSKTFQIKATYAAMMWLCANLITMMVTDSIAKAGDHYLVVFDDTDTMTIRIGLPTQLTLRSGTYGDSKSARLEESLRRRLDFNHDRTLDFAELSRGEQLLKTLDYDEDESLSPLEIEPQLLVAGKETAALNKPIVMHIRSSDDDALLASELARLDRAEEDPLATVDATLEEADVLDRAICVVANEASIVQVQRFDLHRMNSARWILSKGKLVIDLEIDQPIAELKHIDVRPGRRGWFEWLDLDKNSKLSRMELRTAAESLNLSLESDLKSLPIDRSVSIHFTSALRRQQSFVELLPSAVISPLTKADHASQAPAWFTASDHNRDSVLSINEFLAGDDLFQQLDADGDDIVTNEEIKSFNRVPDGPRK